MRGAPQMKEFCDDRDTCRHAALLAYFGERFARGRCGGSCDNCARGAASAADEDPDWPARPLPKQTRYAAMSNSTHADTPAESLQTFQCSCSVPLHRHTAPAHPAGRPGLMRAGMHAPRGPRSGAGRGARTEGAR